MANQFTAGETFTEDEQVTFEKLNLAQTNLKFTDAAVDGVTTARSSEAIIVKSGGIDHAQLKDDAVRTAKIKDGEVTVAKLAGGITNAKMAANSIDSAQYVDGSIDAGHLSATLISAQPELTAVPHLTQDEVLLSNNGVLNSLKLMTYLPLPRAWGQFSSDGTTSPDASDLALYGCSFVSESSGLFTFNLAASLADNYVVITTPFQDAATYWSGGWSHPKPEIVSGSQFQIHWPHTYVSAYDFNFVVFGTLA
jgi:hypothetical protein